jgi:hypothetical protein
MLKALADEDGAATCNPPRLIPCPEASFLKLSSR